MKFIRWLLGKIILFLDSTFAPKSVHRSAVAQQKLDVSLGKLSLYEFKACPFCVKVRRFLKSSSISVPLRDAKTEPYRSELLAGGGKVKVPCLRIESSEGAVRWMYESNDIISYLRNRMGELSL